MATFRWIGVPEAEVRMVDGAHKEQGVVWTGSVGRGQNKCWPETGERLESIVVCHNGGTDKQKDWLNGTKDIISKLLCGDDLTVVVDGEADLQEQLIEWKDMFSTH